MIYISNTLRILSLNTWGLAFPLARDRRRRIGSIGKALDHLGLDLVGLQEVWLKADAEILTQAAQAAGLPYAHYFEGGITGTGLLTLSRYPITLVDFRLFRLRPRPDIPTQADYYAAKGIGLTRIQSPWGELDFYNLHAVAQYEVDLLDRFAAHRASNMYESALFINAHSAQHAAIVTGDFNINPMQLGYRLITSLTGLQDTYTALHPGHAGHTVTHQNMYSVGYVGGIDGERVDYVCIRDGADLSLAAQQCDIVLTIQPDHPKRPYSDHFGLYACLEVQAQTQADFSPHSNPSHHSPSADKAAQIGALRGYIRSLEAAQEMNRNRLAGHRVLALLGLISCLLFSRAKRPRRRIFGLLSGVYSVLQTLLIFFIIPDEARTLSGQLREAHLSLNQLTQPQSQPERLGEAPYK